MLLFHFFSVLVLSSTVTSKSDPLINSLVPRQAGPSTTNCYATCANFQEVQTNCTFPYCGCTLPFLQAQGNCGVCGASTPQDVATIQILLDTEINQCHSEGIKLDFQLDLPPAVAAMVRKFDRDSISLRRSQTAFLALQVAGGHVGLVIILAFGVFSRKTHRNVTFLNFCITWIFFSVIFSLLLYRGTEGNTVVNPLGKVSGSQCLAQAALIDGARVMTACSTLALAIQLWLSLRAVIYGDATKCIRESPWMTWMLLVPPYIFFIAFAFPASLDGSDRIVVDGFTLEKGFPTNFYCTVIDTSTFLTAVNGATIALLIGTAIFKMLSMRLLYKHWRTFRHIRTESPVSLWSLARFMVFSLYYFVVSVIYIAVSRSTLKLRSASFSMSGFNVPIWVDMLQASFPLTGSIVLGFNNDIIHSFMFWRWLRPANTRAVQSISYASANASSSTWNEEAIPETDIEFVGIAI